MTTHMQTLTFVRPDLCDQLTKKVHLTLGACHTLEIDQEVDRFDAQITKNIITVADIQDMGYLLATTFSKATTLQLCIDNTVAECFEITDWIKWLSFGLALSSYHYKHTNSPLLQPTIHPFAIQNIVDSSHQQAFDEGKTLAYSQLIARELMNKPGNVIYPETFVQAVEALAIDNIQLTYLDEAMMLAQGFGGLMGIAQGSDRDARLLCLDYHPASPQLTIALVGKGVTFDSGGISIKQPRFMSTMKVDMGGAAAVVGAMHAIAQLQLPVRVIGLCGLVENMPSGNAIKPGDVVTMLNKTHVEIISTDAEGRMVLADALHYAQQQYQPDYLIDIATLTGGTGVALGKAYASLMGNDDNFISIAQSASQSCSEPLWHMPMGGQFHQALASDFADIRHGSEEPDGSPCVAATFLSHFIQPDQKWLHIDCAAMSLGMTHRKIHPKAASGFGAILLTEICQQLSQHTPHNPQ